ncbi:DNA-binding Lrp family transcriptional regulator [Crossiella equi]|uniref:DNA-binding Lrp family transcriptional regulator n=1 Tax=Crossiella equi TaxID=130796 RepID=A0ABS5A8Q3_9PSEU|nr:hypothetical protein [Crossiella equi]MBP2472957.1 DNA-binding Lrp family transcriptional regulator [Crossiella equi]
MPSTDDIDTRLPLALIATPRATTVAQAEQVGISRNTAQARLTRHEQDGTPHSFERRVNPAALGYPLVRRAAEG